ncbi:hypothetical protein [Bacillus sp. Marseille-Q1617]|uniref:hypothetical protein n=1 Tax=Bacillus sp. Marseille-Q1617 TaxID=2736887 RepID=UPI0015891859|nr:hypothetical protein [Bacillus sp. Marseille-Q1617]
MGWFFDFTLQYFHLFLIVVLIMLVTLVMSKFFKRKRTLVMGMTLFVLGAFIIVHQSTYTTFPDLYDKTLKEDSVIDAIKIRVYDPSNEVLETNESKTIEEQDTIERLMDDFSKIELKKAEGMPRDLYKYHVEIIVTNQVGEDRYLTKVIHVRLDQKSLDDYKIISDTNHLKTVQTLVGSKDDS